MPAKPKKADYILPLRPVERIIKKARAKRISPDAVKALGSILEKCGAEISDRAIDLAMHMSRETVKERDIVLAFKQWRSERSRD